MRTIVAPDDVTREDVEDLVLQVNRAFRDLDAQGIAPIVDGIDLNNLQQVIHAEAAVAPHDNLTGVPASVAHLLFLLLDGTRPMTGDLDMATHALVFRGSTAVQLRSQAAGYANLEATTQIYFDINTGHKMYLNSTHFVLDDVDVDMVGHHIDNIEWLKWDTSSLTGGLGVAAVGGVGTVFGIIDGGGGDMPVGQFTGDGSDGIHIGGLTLGYGGNILTVAMNGADAELDLDTAATIKFLKDTLNPASTKHYFDVGAAIGTEFITSGANGYLDDWVLTGRRIYINEALHLTISRGAGYTYVRAPADTRLSLGGYSGSTLLLGSGFVQIAAAFQCLGNFFNYSDARYIYLGAGDDASLRYDGVNLDIRPAIKGTGYVNIYKATDAQSVAMLTLEGDRATMGDDDEIYQSWKLSNDAGQQTEYGRYSVVAEDVSDGTEDGAFTWDVMVDGALTEAFAIGSEGASFASGMRVEQATISAAATLTAAHYIVICDTDTAGAAFTVTLPAAASHADRVYYIKNTGTGGFDVTVDGDGAETIDGDATQTVIDGHCLAIVCDGTEWWVI